MSGRARGYQAKALPGPEHVSRPVEARATEALVAEQLCLRQGSDLGRVQVQAQALVGGRDLGRVQVQVQALVGGRDLGRVQVQVQAQAQAGGRDLGRVQAQVQVQAGGRGRGLRRRHRRRTPPVAHSRAPRSRPHSDPSCCPRGTATGGRSDHTGDRRAAEAEGGSP